MKGYTYIVANQNDTVLYVGATNDIKKRMNEHKHRVYKNSFTKRYNCDKLVYFEEVDRVDDAFVRERQLKAGNRTKKEALINSTDLEWKDLSEEWFDADFLKKRKQK